MVPSESMNRRHYFWFALSVASVAAACAYLVFILVGGHEPNTPALTWVQLANTTYPSDLVRSKQVALTNGMYSEQIAPGSASRVQVRLADIAAFGDLRPGGHGDAAVVLISSGGGSGAFIHLVAVLNDHGLPHVAATTLLGDRVAVRGIQIQDGGTVTVRMRVRSEGDPLTSLTREVTRVYRFDGASLQLQSEASASVALPDPSRFVYAPTTVSITPGGDPFTASKKLVPGSALDYVVHASTGEQLDVRVTSEFQNAVLSIQGLDDLAQVVGRDQFLAAFTGPVPATQDYSVRVISLAGSDLDTSVRIALGPARATPAGARPATPVPTTGAPPGSAAGAPPAFLSGPFRPTSRPLADYAPDAAAFVATRSPSVAVAVADPAGNSMYALNADAQLELASVVKVLILADVLATADRENRFVDDTELALLWPMITQSDNDAATALWRQIGGGPGLLGYLQSIGVTGVAPYDGDFWGTTTASASSLASLVSRLLFGDLVRDEHRRLALTLMESVRPSQRWGVSAAARPADVVALKNGWYQADAGWRVNSVGVLFNPADRAAPIAVAVLTNLQPTFEYGLATVEGIAQGILAARSGAAKP